MTVISLTVLLFIWYFPLNHIRQIVKTVSQMEYKEEFILTVYNSGIDVGEDEKAFFISIRRHRFEFGKQMSFLLLDMIRCGFL